MGVIHRQNKEYEVRFVSHRGHVAFASSKKGFEQAKADKELDPSQIYNVVETTYRPFGSLIWHEGKWC